MKYLLISLSAVALLFFAAASESFAIEVVNKEDFQMDIGGRLQVFGLGERVNDAVRDKYRLFLFLKQSRLGFTGAVYKWKYDVQLAFAGEEEVKAPSPGVSLNLLDFSFDIPLIEDFAFIKVGQFKIPYSGERLADSAYLQFADRSLQNLAFRVGRDVGAAVHLYPGSFVLAGGIFTGGGRDVPERFLPENLGIPLFVGRAGYDSSRQKDLFKIRQSQEVDKLIFAAFGNAFYMEDTIIGHSTVLGVKLSEKSLLINENWNPYLKQAPLVKGKLWQVGWDASLKVPLFTKYTLSSEAELNYGRYSNAYGSVDATGGRAQAGLYRKPFEAALRYAFLKPDQAFTNSNSRVTGDSLMHELTPSLTCHFPKDERIKLILDFPVLINVPVVHEPGVGAYVLTEQPDQAAVLAPKTRGSAERQTVLQARALLQLAF